VIGIVVITHGVFGQNLLRTAQDMVGTQDQVTSITLTSEMGGEGLTRLLKDAQAAMKDLDGMLYLVDMLGGTPCTIVLLNTKDQAAEIVTGVNLYMMLSAFKNRETMDLTALAARASEDGRKSIVLPKALMAKKGV
jgi:PTS system mannose-specific IIA component